jgi:proline iminopeptidase
MSEAREGYLPVPGAQLYFREIGAGPPLLVLHGGPDFNHSYLLPDLDRLSRSFRLIYYDQRGRGRSSGAVVPDDVGLDSEMDDLDRVRRYLGLDAIAMLGHSWGGLLAMEYATRHPDRVSRMILLNTGPASSADLARFQEWRRATEAETLATMRAVAERREYATGDIATEAEYYRAHFSGTLRRPEQIEAIVRRLRLDFTPADILKARAIEQRLYAQTWLSPGYDLLPRFRRLNVPTLVIYGERDLFPLDGIQKIAEAIPGAHLVVLKECGHFSYLERPAEVESAIAEHFSRR